MSALFFCFVSLLHYIDLKRALGGDGAAVVKNAGVNDVDGAAALYYSRFAAELFALARTHEIQVAAERYELIGVLGDNDAGGDIAHGIHDPAVRHAEEISRLGAKLGLDDGAFRLYVGHKNMIIFIIFAARIDFIYKPLLVHNCPP